MKKLITYIQPTDIKNYLLKHQDERNLKYKEALFLKYFDDTDMYTKEKYEMCGDDNSNEHLFSFDKYIKIISENHYIDTADICLMLVPALGLNSLYSGDIDIGVNYIKNYARLLDDNANMEKVITEAIYRLRYLSKEYNKCKDGIDYPLKEIGIFNDTLENYSLLRNFGIIEYNGRDFSLIGKERCEKELDSYANIYGEEAVEIIKEYTKELKRKYL